MAKGIQERERSVAQVFVEAFSDQGPLLLAGDHHGFAGSALTALNHDVQRWSRWSGPLGPGTAWPVGGPFASAALRIPKEKPALDLAIHGLAAHLKVGGALWLYGANDEGIRSVIKRASPLFDDVRTLSTKRHCRVIRGIRTEATPTSPLTAWRVDGQICLDEDTIPWVSYPGVFAKGALDEGTETLLRVVGAPPQGARILDFACGTGVIAASLARRTPSITPTLCDADAIAAESARANVPDGAIFVGDGWSAVPTGPYDWIVSNPPIHAGKLEDHRVLHALIENAPGALAPGGTLWMVVQRRVSLDRRLRDRFSQVRLAHQTSRFRIWCAQ